MLYYWCTTTCTECEGVHVHKEEHVQKIPACVCVHMFTCTSNTQHTQKYTCHLHKILKLLVRLLCSLCWCTIPLALDRCFHRYFQHTTQLCKSDVVPCSKKVVFLLLDSGTTWNFAVTLNHGNTSVPQFFTIWSVRFSFRLVDLTPERGKGKQLCCWEIHLVPFCSV